MNLPAGEEPLDPSLVENLFKVETNNILQHLTTPNHNDPVQHQLILHRRPHEIQQYILDILAKRLDITPEALKQLIDTNSDLSLAQELAVGRITVARRELFLGTLENLPPSTTTMEAMAVDVNKKRSAPTEITESRKSQAQEQIEEPPPTKTAQQVQSEITGEERRKISTAYIRAYEQLLRDMQEGSGQMGELLDEEDMGALLLQLVKQTIGNDLYKQQTADEELGELYDKLLDKLMKAQNGEEEQPSRKSRALEQEEKSAPYIPMERKTQPTTMAVAIAPPPTTPPASSSSSNSPIPPDTFEITVYYDNAEHRTVFSNAILRSLGIAKIGEKIGQGVSGSVFLHCTDVGKCFKVLKVGITENMPWEEFKTGLAAGKKGYGPKIYEGLKEKSIGVLKKRPGNEFRPIVSDVFYSTTRDFTFILMERLTGTLVQACGLHVDVDAETVERDPKLQPPIINKEDASKIYLLIKEFNNSGFRHRDTHMNNVMYKLLADNVTKRWYLIDFTFTKYTPNEPVTDNGDLVELVASIMNIFEAGKIGDINDFLKELEILTRVTITTTIIIFG